MEKQQGSSLIEVMVGLLILAIGLLGMASLQNVALRESNNTYLYSQANFLLQDGLDRIRSNAKKIPLYRTQFSELADVTGNCINVICTSSQLASWDLQSWKQQVEQQLPQGRAEIKTDNNGLVVISIEFDDSRGANSAINLSASTYL